MLAENYSFLLTALLALPFAGMILIGLAKEKLARPLAISFSLANLVLSLFIWSAFNTHIPGFQFQQLATWITNPLPLQYHVGIDGFSLCLVLLTTFINLMAVLASDTIKMRPKLYYSLLMLLNVSILGVFISLDLLQFFIFYELELVPMYFLIAIWADQGVIMQQ